MSLRAKVGELWLETQILPSDPCLHQKNEQKAGSPCRGSGCTGSGVGARRGWAEGLCFVLDGRCRLWVWGAQCSTAWLQGNWQEAKPCSRPPPSHAVASCCCPLLSKPKCFLISLLHFPEPFWVLATSRMALRATPASGAQCTHRVQAAKSSHSWSVALGPAWLCAPALHRSLLLGA